MTLATPTVHPIDSFVLPEITPVLLQQDFEEPLPSDPENMISQVQVTNDLPEIVSESNEPSVEQALVQEEHQIPDSNVVESQDTMVTVHIDADEPMVIDQNNEGTVISKQEVRSDGLSKLQIKLPTSTSSIKFDSTGESITTHKVTIKVTGVGS